MVVSVPQWQCWEQEQQILLWLRNKYVVTESSFDASVIPVSDDGSQVCVYPKGTVGSLAV